VRYTPVELRHVKSAVRGAATPGTRSRVARGRRDSFEDVWRERGELTDKLHEVQKTLDEVKQRESLPASTLVRRSAAVDASRRRGAGRPDRRRGTRRARSCPGGPGRAGVFAEARRVESSCAALGMIEESRCPAGGDEARRPRRILAARRTPQFRPVAVETPTARGAAAASSHRTPRRSAVPGRDFAWG
jgi:hypothetical protein